MIDDTILVGAGRYPKRQSGAVNPPVFRASTILFDSVAELQAAAEQPFDAPFYGRLGTPTTFAFEEAMAAAEGGYRSIATSSGLAAIGAALFAFLTAGDHLLMVDTVYEPARRFCNRLLTRAGVEISYYDPLIGGDIRRLMRPSTRVVYMESPGSHTFEVQNVAEITTAAHEAEAVAIIDNTWASPLYFKPFECGVDVSIQAATKYIVGHSDAMLGVITTTRDSFDAVRRATQDLGACAGSEECFLGLRGLRTLHLRMPRHQENALALASWLQGRPEIDRVLYPALEGDPGYPLWKRDFVGASGLFGVVLKPVSDRAVAAMLDGFRLFGIGYSWGGFESLVLPTHPERSRTATTWSAAGPALRFHAGLEAAADLLADLEAGLGRLAAAA